jgi:DNA repair photolyase
MRIVYEPTGRALEYSPLAVSLYRGCSHGCTYCFAPDVTRTERDKFIQPYPRKNAIALLKKDCEELEQAKDQREILMSFTTDPYQPIEDQHLLTQQAIKLFHKYNRKYSILTKGGNRSKRDLDLMAERTDLCRYATTLTCCLPEYEQKWEPYAASWGERVSALREAHELGIKTWVSIEPIIDPWQSRYLIAETIGYVDLYRIGKMNHTDPGFPETDLYEFVKGLQYLFEAMHKEHIFKKDMQPYLQRMM